MGDAQTLSIPAQNCTLSYSNDWSSNGDRSLKIYSNTNKTFYCGPQSTNLGIHNLCMGKTIQFQADINTNIPLYLRVYTNVNGTWTFQSVLISSSSNDVTVTVDVPEDCSNLWFRVDSTKGYDDVTVYTDNWRLFILGG